MGRFAYLVHGMFRKNSTKTMMLALLSDEVAKFMRMWPRFVVKWREVMFFCCERKKKNKKKKKKKKGGWAIVGYNSSKFSMETGNEILPSVITS
jgi:hypothetical protein